MDSSAFRGMDVGDLGSALIIGFISVIAWVVYLGYLALSWAYNHVVIV